MARTRTRSLDQPDENPEQGVEVVSDSRRRRREAAGEAAQQAVTRKDRPTPTTRQVKPRAASGEGIISRIPVVRSIAAYFHGVATELRKVSWPSREDTLRLTGVVLAVTVAFAIALGILDTFLAWWFQQAFSPDSETTFLGVAAVVLLVVGGSFAYIRSRV